MSDYHEGTRNFNSISVDSLTDGTDGSAWETLREVGFETGDFLPLYTSFVDGSESTSSSSYNINRAGIEARIVWDVLFPSAVTTQAVLFGNVDPSGDVADLKLTNFSDGETILEKTGISSKTDVAIGPVDYRPTTTASPVSITTQLRNNDNSTSVTLSDPGYAFGVKI